MSGDEARRAVVRNWMAKADAALAAARREWSAGDTSLAVNRVYYACFYAATALLLQEQKEFTKHVGVRAAVHRHLVKPGRISAIMGKFYDQAFNERQEADYTSLAEFEAATVAERIDDAERFVAEMKRLLKGE